MSEEQTRPEFDVHAVHALAREYAKTFRAYGGVPVEPVEPRLVPNERIVAPAAFDALLDQRMKSRRFRWRYRVSRVLIALRRKRTKERK